MCKRLIFVIQNAGGITEIKTMEGPLDKEFGLGTDEGFRGILNLLVKCKCECNLFCVLYFLESLLKWLATKNKTLSLTQIKWNLANNPSAVKPWKYLIPPTKERVARSKPDASSTHAAICFRAIKTVGLSGKGVILWFLYLYLYLQTNFLSVYLIKELD